MTPELILVNPWIYDFAAFDLWSKPLGLLSIAGALRRRGFKIHLIDCLDVHSPGMEDYAGKRPLQRPYGTGKLWRQHVSRPQCLMDTPRSYSRYGISTQLFLEELKKVRNPSAILVTSMMTYWYPGVQEAIRLCREIHPNVPVLLGGTYARLCTDHALRHSGADTVITQSKADAVEAVLSILEARGITIEPPSEASAVHAYPAFDLFTNIDYVCLLTSVGCPYRCPYCAASFLYPKMERRDPQDVFEEVLFWNGRYGVRDFAFYDDALLVSAESHAALFLERIARRKLNVRFHTPNALHVREIRPQMANLLLRAGFRTIRLGLETSDPALHSRMGNKFSEGEFEEAVSNLRSAGFARSEIGAYILMGLPDQSLDSVLETIRLADKAGATPYLAEYSPMPHTALWEEALSISRYDLISEPLLHNNTLLPCWDEGQRARVPELRAIVRGIRGRGRSGKTHQNR